MSKRLSIIVIASIIISFTLLKIVVPKELKIEEFTNKTSYEHSKTNNEDISTPLYSTTSISKKTLSQSKIQNISPPLSVNSSSNERSVEVYETNVTNTNRVEEIEFTLTFYTYLSEENGEYEGLNAMGSKIRYGQVASNVYSFNTAIELDGYGKFIVADRGGNEFNSPNRLDVYIPREEGESRTDYYNRVNAMGRVKVKGWILN